jgi:serine/threonine protein kinase
MLMGSIKKYSTVSKYRLIEKLTERDRNFDIYRAYSEKDQATVIIKVSSSDYSSRNLEQMLRNEFEIGRVLNPKLFIRPIRMDSLGQKPVLVLEDFRGVPLVKQLGPKMRIDVFLDYALKITDGLIDLLNHHTIHKDIKPENIIVSLNRNELKITDFGISSTLPREQTFIQSPNLLQGSFPYMAPEQTGRISRGLDHRTDLYSTGITFYWMLTGQLPFQAEDPIGWIYCHIAKKPKPPVEIVQHLPKVISDIVMKLLEKDSEDRYQSAYGLRSDLEKCLSFLQNHQAIQDFRIADQDVSSSIEVSQRLYGREPQIRYLLECF